MSPDEILIELRRIVCSVKFELSKDNCGVILRGPDMGYHSVDPYFQGYLQKHRITENHILSYMSRSDRLDICFEDSWSGFFIADRMDRNRYDDGFTIVHLDDHTDMMATLLSVSEGGLLDPTNGTPFDARSVRDWKSAIHSGALNIGNYLTPFYYSHSNVHIRHLNDHPEQSELRWITRALRQYPLIPELAFASLAKVDSRTPEVVGSYWATSIPHPAFLKSGPEPVIVHIDLDYFINDFNGASKGADYVPHPALRLSAYTKLDHFFEALLAASVSVDRWMVATSPGFCSAFHWDWLLAEIEQRIHKHHRQTG